MYRRQKRFAINWFWAGMCLLASGCGSSNRWSDLPSANEKEHFVRQVYPVLMRDCGFVECHGAEARFFRVAGPGRARLDPAMDVLDPVTPAELTLSYERARSMLAHEQSVQDALLLRKPLSTGAGGAEHDGVDSLGRDAYSTREDPGYVVLRRWAERMTGQVTP